MQFVIEVGDTIQARKQTPQGVIPLEFLVTGITGDVVEGSQLGDLDPADGWTFELVRKGDPGLPETLSDLAVWTIASPATPLRVVGPTGGIWQVPGGPVINPADVLAWEVWEDPAPPTEPEQEQP